MNKLILSLALVACLAAPTLSYAGYHYSYHWHTSHHWHVNHHWHHNWHRG